MAQQVAFDGTPTNGLNPYIDSLVWGGRWTSPSDPSNPTQTVITYSFGQGSDPAGLIDNPLNWTDAGRAAVNAAFAAFERVINVDFVLEADGSETDMTYWAVGSDHYATEAIPAQPATAEHEATEAVEADDGTSTLGEHDVPFFDEDNYFYGTFNVEIPEWQQSQALGSNAFNTILHEIGHGLGLAHPFDGGEAEDATAFPGVTGAADVPGETEVYGGTPGDGSQNNQINTIMSYHAPAVTGTDEATDNNRYGYFGSPMALDIMALQAIYGPSQGNASAGAGDDVYYLPTANRAGTYWMSIWDTGGRETISAGNTRGNAVIDLNATPSSRSSEDQELPAFAGGPQSYVRSASDGAYIHGGFTIAAGTVIEDAVGGRGNDQIYGNEVDNILFGGGGNDAISGGGDNDRLWGGRGDDNLDGGDGDDELDGERGNDTMRGGNGSDAYTVDSTQDVIIETASEDAGENDRVTAWVDYTLSENVEALTLAGRQNLSGTGNNQDNTITGNRAENVLIGFDGADQINGENGNDWISGGGGNDFINGGRGRDIIYANGGSDLINGGSGGDLINGSGGGDTIEGNGGGDTINGGGGRDTLDGGAGNDVINGGGGRNVIIGGAGRDMMTGGSGVDRFIFYAASESRRGNGSDTITNFDTARDQIVLPAISEIHFVGSFTGVAGQIRQTTDGTDTAAVIDTDGDGSADMRILFQGLINLTENVFSIV